MTASSGASSRLGACAAVDVAAAGAPAVATGGGAVGVRFDGVLLLGDEMAEAAACVRRPNKLKSAQLVDDLVGSPSGRGGGWRVGRFRSSARAAGNGAAVGLLP